MFRRLHMQARTPSRKRPSTMCRCTCGRNVIALVNPASASSPSTTYTYDPLGNPSIAGASSNWPFLYQGMEHESIDPNQFYYSGNGAYYSAQIMRSMSMTSAQGTSGPGGGRVRDKPAYRQSARPPMRSTPEGVFRAPPKGLAPALAQVEASPPSAQNRCSHRTQYQSPSGWRGRSIFELLAGSPWRKPRLPAQLLHRPVPAQSPARRPASAVYSLYWDDSGIVVDQKGPHCLCGDPHPCASSPLATACPGDMLCNPTPTPESAPGYPLGLGPNAIPPPKPQTGATYWSCVFRKLATVRIAECFGCIIGGGSLPESGWKVALARRRLAARVGNREVLPR